jgi:environmental stress-induced protein Ves
MKWLFRSLDAVELAPWKNGGGVTRELLASYPDRDGWDLRVSVADIAQDGPFSSFPACERWFVVLEGAGVRLDVAGTQVTLDARSAPFHFDGGAAVDCSLVAGPTRDFNLMTWTGDGRRSVLQRVGGRLERALPAGTLVGVYAHAAPARIVCHGDVAAVAPRTLAWQVLPSAQTMEVEAEDALWMEFPP